jgi:AraC-like DNA-binding protein
MEDYNEKMRQNYFHYQRSIPGTDCAYLYSSISAPMHRHMDFYEFSLVTYGSFVNHYNGRAHTIRKNCLLYFRCQEAHSIQASNEQSTHFSFIVKKERFEALCKQFFPHSDFFSQHNCVEKQLTELQGEYLANLFKSLYICAAGDDLQVRLEMFLYNAMALVQSGVERPHSERSTDRYIDKLLTNLNNFAYVPLKVSQIYKEYPLAQSTLINSFRKRTGYTIVQYLGIKKMEYAAQMLRNSENNVTDIAAVVGISSLSHFIHKFKEHFGITPKEYQLLHAVDSAADDRQEEFNAENADT